jgi:hypothetical protein
MYQIVQEHLLIVKKIKIYRKDKLDDELQKTLLGSTPENVQLNNLLSTHMTRHRSYAINNGSNLLPFEISYQSPNRNLRDKYN